MLLDAVVLFKVVDCFFGDFHALGGAPFSTIIEDLRASIQSKDDSFHRSSVQLQFQFNI